MNRLAAVFLCTGILASSTAIAMEYKEYCGQHDTARKEFSRERDLKLSTNQKTALTTIDYSKFVFCIAHLPIVCYLFASIPARDTVPDAVLQTALTAWLAYILAAPVLFFHGSDFLKGKLYERWVPKAYKTYCEKSLRIDKAMEMLPILRAQFEVDTARKKEAKQDEEFRAFVRSRGGNRLLDESESDHK